MDAFLAIGRIRGHRPQGRWNLFTSLQFCQKVVQGFPPQMYRRKKMRIFPYPKKYTKLLWHLRKGNVHFLSSKYHMFPTDTFLFLQQVASKSNFMAIYTAIPYRIGDDEDFFVFLTKTSLASIIDSTKQLDRDLVCFSI